MASPSREEIEARMGELTARMEASEARIDKTLASLKGELALQITTDVGAIKTDLATKPGIGTLVIVGLAIAGTIVGVLAFGGDRFDGGVQVAGTSVQQAADAKALAEETAKRMDEVAKQNELILSLIQKDQVNEP